MNVDVNYLDNKMIAEFMGYEVMNEYCDNSLGKEVESLPMLNYMFDSWNELMPVVKKCTDLVNQFQYDDDEYIHWNEEIFNPDYMINEFITNDIQSIYQRVIKFINWYNIIKIN